MLINLLTIIVFLLMFSVLVSVHELGHYLFARRYKMGVSEFSIGIGPKVWTWARRKYKNELGEEKETEFNLRGIPLGGFVKILGMEHDDDAAAGPIPDGFYSRPPANRIAVLLAGPIFSLVFGWLILFSVFSISGDIRGTNEVAGVLAGLPAEKAGIREHDKVLSINGHPVSDNTEGVRIIRESNAAQLSFHIERQGKPLDVSIQPVMSEEERPIMDEDGAFTGEYKKIPQVGIYFGSERVSVPIPQAMGLATKYPAEQVRVMFKKLTQPKVLINSSTGPVGMAVMTKEAVQSGMSTVFLITGLISLSLGIFNLLPIYPLDGGQIVISVVEWVRKGRQVSLQVKNALLLVGITFIGFLFVVRIYKDLKQYVIPGKENLIQGTGKPQPKIESGGTNSANAPVK